MLRVVRQHALFVCYRAWGLCSNPLPCTASTLSTKTASSFPIFAYTRLLRRASVHPGNTSRTARHTVGKHRRSLVDSWLRNAVGASNVTVLGYFFSSTFAKATQQGCFPRSQRLEEENSHDNNHISDGPKITGFKETYGTLYHPGRTIKPNSTGRTLE